MKRLMLFLIAIEGLSYLADGHAHQSNKLQNDIGSKDWHEVIKNKQNILSNESYLLLNKQLQSYGKGNSPKIADPIIKSIEISECGEELIDLKKMHHNRIVMLPDPERPFASSYCNSGFSSASKMRKSVYMALGRMIHCLDELAPHFGYEAGNITIKVFEALRDLNTQELIFENKKKEILAAQPMLTDEEAFAETCKWVSPVRDNIPVHSTGAAVDIRLWNSSKQEFLDMGIFGVIWGKNSAAPTFSHELTAEQKKNRLLLLVAAAKVGLINYSYEWWHFSVGDRYASYWLEQESKKKACYGAIAK